MPAPRAKGLSAAAAVVMGLALALIAGCDNAAERNDYVQQVNAVQRDFERDARRVSTALRDSDTPSQTRRGIRALAASVRDAAARLDGLEAPDRVSGSHEQFVQTLRQYAERVESTAVLASSRDPRKRLRAQRTLQRATEEQSQEISRLIEEINRQLQTETA